VSNNVKCPKTQDQHGGRRELLSEISNHSLPKEMGLSKRLKMAKTNMASCMRIYHVYIEMLRLFWTKLMNDLLFVCRRSYWRRNSLSLYYSCRWNTTNQFSQRRWVFLSFIYIYVRVISVYIFMRVIIVYIFMSVINVYLFITVIIDYMFVRVIDICIFIKEINIYIFIRINNVS